MKATSTSVRSLFAALGLVFGLFLLEAAAPVAADETCMSPYMAKIVGQEDYVYVWTLGVEGLGDEQDKLVTIDVNPQSKTYGTIVESLSVGGRNEAHHSGLTDYRRYLWAGGLDTNKIFIFDVATNPAKPALHKTITDFVDKSGGVVGPHTDYAMPGRMLITGLSNHKDHGGETAMVEYTNDGNYVATYWMPKDGDLNGAVKGGQFADGWLCRRSHRLLSILRCRHLPLPDGTCARGNQSPVRLHLLVCHHGGFRGHGSLCHESRSPAPALPQKFTPRRCPDQKLLIIPGPGRA